MLNKDKLKRAFSLVELAMIITFIGVIIVFELMVLNRKINNYSASYYNAYNTLSLIAYNVFIDPECSFPYDPNPDSSMQEKMNACYPEDLYDYETATGMKRKFPATGVELCERMTEFLNTGSAANCKARSINKNADNIMQWVNKNGKKIWSDANTIRFVTSNANRFYIDDTLYSYGGDTSGKKNKYYKQEYENFRFPDGSLEEIKYFLVYVDINGANGPNKIKMEKDDKYLPDIVPFAITTRGEVIPMGYPVYSKDYLTAQVRYTGTESGVVTDESGNESGSTDEKITATETMTYYEAISKAFGDENGKCNNPDKLINIHNKYSFQTCGTLNKTVNKNNLAMAFLYNGTNLPKTPARLNEDKNTKCANGKKDCVPIKCDIDDDSKCQVIIQGNSNTRIRVSS